MRLSHPFTGLVLVLVGALATGCVTDDSSPVDDQHSNVVADDPTQPPHPYPKPPNHYNPSNKPCQYCHKPPGYPGPGPIPGQCAGCHNVRPPNDPHWPNYPMGRGPDLPPGPVPIPPYCLECHNIAPRPIPVVVTQDLAL